MNFDQQMDQVIDTARAELAAAGDNSNDRDIVVIVLLALAHKLDAPTVCEAMVDVLEGRNVRSPS